jgi:CDP-3, 6-dideoxy-D-glycero-L-glycero-4-hexulose-4-reductase
MRVIVAGANGFIGSNLCKHFQKNNIDFIGLVRSSPSNLDKRINSNLVKLENNNILPLQIQDLFNNFKPTALINAATMYIRKDDASLLSSLVESNIYFPSQLLENCIKNNVKYIHLTSNWQMKNKEKYNSVNLYAASKNSFEIILSYLIETKQIMASSIILYDTYGPNDLRDKVLNYLIMNAMKNVDVELTHPKKQINLTHIDDIVKGIELIIKEKSIMRFYELSNTDNITLYELFNIVKNVTQSNFKVSWKHKTLPDSFEVQQVKNIANYPELWNSSIQLSEGIQQIYETEKIKLS